MLGSHREDDCVPSTTIPIARHTRREPPAPKHAVYAGAAEQQFRRIIGYRDLAKLVIAIERRAARLTDRADTTSTHTQLSEAVTV